MTKTRVLTALVMAPLAICAILFLPTQWLSPMAAVVFLIALWEWLKLSGVSDSLPRTILLLLNLLLMVSLVWASRTRDGFSPILFQLTTVLGAGGWALSLIWLKLFRFGASNHWPARALKLAAGTLAIIPAWCALGLLHSDNFVIPSSQRPPISIHLWLLMALMIVWAADTGAYFAGKRFGKHKLAPRISPNKTIEGAAGGFIGGMLVALIFGMILGVENQQWLPLLGVAFFTIIASIVGDLAESLLKRQANVKDSGTLIPGHGGVLDRVDSLLAALPAFALGKEIAGL